MQLCLSSCAISSAIEPRQGGTMSDSSSRVNDKVCTPENIFRRPYIRLRPCLCPGGSALQPCQGDTTSFLFFFVYREVCTTSQHCLSDGLSCPSFCLKCLYLKIGTTQLYVCMLLSFWLEDLHIKIQASLSHVLLVLPSALKGLHSKLGE